MAQTKSKAKPDTSNRAPRLDIFEQIRAAQSRDYEWLDSQPEQLRKTFVPFILNRWLSGSNNPADVLAADITNKYVWSLHDHPGLLWRLMCSSGSVSRNRRSWIKANGKSGSKNDIRIEVIADYHRISGREAKIMLESGHLTIDHVIEMAESLGLQSEVTDKLKKLAKNDE